MKKRIVSAMAILALVLGTTMTANAQIFLDDDDMNVREHGNMDVGNIIPQHGVDWDQADYTPVGEGIVLLSVLGGAYLLGKKRQKEQ